MFLGKTAGETQYVLMMPRYVPVVVILFILIGGGYAWLHRKRR